jgi:hypothetical protein
MLLIAEQTGEFRPFIWPYIIFVRGVLDKLLSTANLLCIARSVKISANKKSQGFGEMSCTHNINVKDIKKSRKMDRSVEE